MDEADPGLGHGFVVAFFQFGGGCIPGGGECLEAGADFRDGFGEGMSAEVEVSDFDVIAMMEVFESAGFEGGEEFIIVHGRGCWGGDATDCGASWKGRVRGGCDLKYGAL